MKVFKNTPRDPEILAAKEILDVAADSIGDEVLTEFEERFVTNTLKQITEHGDGYDLSTNRKDVIAAIERKLKKENLL